ncbi:hypothetical protein MKW94_026818 [Papaver nudicaule]|uniref:C3H1-type domain-containing protein n=1 Tax=Papaver nudicaule TaxID=74823 RepID=A0AA41SBU0_PAPNU|nr:hypothetical protein [Papaver nudicaule]
MKERLRQLTEAGVSILKNPRTHSDFPSMVSSEFPSLIPSLSAVRNIKNNQVATNRKAPVTRPISRFDEMPESPQVQLPTVPGVDESIKGGKKKEMIPLEMDAYYQGMSKTKLCSEWLETGVCPYVNDCQWAHGTRELRPVRQPRYKTQVCRMVLHGGFCRYGHRCRFRHALTDQEKRIRTAHCSTYVQYVDSESNRKRRRNKWGKETTQKTQKHK